MHAKQLISIFILLVGLSCSLQSQTIQPGSSRSDALGGSGLLSDPTPLDVFLTGSSLLKKKTFTFEFGYKRQYDLKELDILQSAVSIQKNKFTFAVGYTQLGKPELYTQKLYKFGLLYEFNNFVVGNYISRESHDFNNHYESLHKTTYSLSIQYHTKTYLFSSKIENINRSKLYNTANETFPVFRLYGELLLLPNYTTTLNFSTVKEQPNKIGVGESITLSQLASLLFGFSTAPKEFGTGIEFHLNNNNLIYTTSYHPVLGFTYTISFLMSY